MNINEDDVVLEVGSGHNPHARSDILLDLYEFDEKDGHRCGTSIVKDRPFINADICKMPFKDKEIDYVLAIHVLEHTDNPEIAISEIQRVGKRGFLSLPTELFEYLHPTKEHRWFCNLYNNKLIFKRKPTNWVSPFGNLFHELFNKDVEYFWFFQHHSNLFHLKYEWEDKINFEIQKYSLPDFTSLNLNHFVQKNNRGIKDFVPSFMWHKIGGSEVYPKIKKIYRDIVYYPTQTRSNKIKQIMENITKKL